MVQMKVKFTVNELEMECIALVSLLNVSFSKNRHFHSEAALQ